MTGFIHCARPIFCICLLVLIAACSSDDNVELAACDTLVSETRTACLDMVGRGLDISCNTYLGAIDTAMEQAGGNLFDTGSAATDKSSAYAFCSTYVDKLRKDREAHADSMHAQEKSSSTCTALVDRFEEKCMANIGKEPLPGKCKNVARTFVMGAARQRPQEQLCSLAGMQLMKE